MAADSDDHSEATRRKASPSRGGTSHIDSGEAPEEGAFRVALVCMPFAQASMPAIQVGLLTSLAKRAGFLADGFYFNLDLSAQIGPKRYEWLCEHHGQMTGEWLFTVAAFGDQRGAESDDYLQAFPGQRIWCDAEGRGTDGDAAAGDLSELREQILPAYVDRCADSVDWSRYRVVGFTSTFQQTTASLALAARIKQISPDTVVVFGGANMESSMGAEHLRAFPVIDYVVVGEADTVFPQMLNALADGRPAVMPGVLGRRTGEARSGQATPVHDLDALPVPDYHDFYEQSNKLGLALLPRLPIEGSRGCWWGQKHHCTFCGLNGEGMVYRHKSPKRFLAEVDELSKTHGVRTFGAVDNILYPKYLSGVFDVIAEQRIDYEFFFEVKPSVGRREQLQRLYRGGVRSIQPGIESLSTHVLELMDKGTTMLDNVRLLKWARYYGIRVSWNLLRGFPGETLTDYQAELEVLRQLSHLQPPSGVGRIWLERFSPYFMDRDRYPLRNIRPLGSYRYVYPETVRLDDIAYYFDYEMDDTVEEKLLHETDALVKDWRRRWAGGATSDSLRCARTPAMLTITDTRGREKPLVYDIHGPMAYVYESCLETHRSVAEITAVLDDEFPKSAFTETEVLRALEKYRDAGLMVGEDDRYFSLALPANPNW
jgi:ribosomal peptide maturation radical SAM protein 1